jgi:UDP-N-acetyl-D-glucosamine/UDP-N-acetyl-D-galactosamine dehydrogenase
MEKIKIGIIGLGYVGLPLAVEFSKKYDTLGIDINTTRISELKEGIDKTLEVTSDDLKAAKFLEFSSNFKDLKECNYYIVTVPTPIDKNKRPDLTPLFRALEAVGKTLNKGDIVIYESTVYPGATEEDCVPILEQVSGLKFNTDFYCGYSPERINPGDKEHTVSKILKVTSGSTSEIAIKVDNLYKSVITSGTHLASSIKVAEAGKVILDDKGRLLSENESVYIPLGIVHALENLGKIPLELIDVQSGSYLGEDDIVRLDDRYGRA